MDERLERYIRDLSLLIDLPTVSDVDAPNEEAFSEFRQRLRALFPRVFATFRYEEFHGSILLSCAAEGDAEPVLFMSHHDVVSENGIWEHEPFHEIVDGLSPYLLILFIYFVVVLTELFIASGSAKAVLLIPLILPIATAFNIPANMVVLAYIFGDGFANYIYPTDAALPISLNLSDYTYVRYIKDTWIYHLLTFLFTCGILLLGLAVGYQ